MLADVVEHIRHRPARRDGIDGDLLVAAVLGEDADEGVDRPLGPGVERVLGHREVPGRVGRHEDDPPAGVEVAVRLACDEELPARVEREDAVELLLYPDKSDQQSVSPRERPAGNGRGGGETNLGNVSQMPKAHHPGIAAHDIQPPKVPDRLVHQTSSLSNNSNIGLKGDSIGAEGLDLGDDLLGRRLGGGVVDDHARAAAGQLDGHGGADAAAGAGDEGDFAIQAVRDVRGGRLGVGGGGCHGAGWGPEGHGEGWDVKVGLLLGFVGVGSKVR